MPFYITTLRTLRVRQYQWRRVGGESGYPRVYLSTYAIFINPESALQCPARAARKLGLARCQGAATRAQARELTLPLRCRSAACALGIQRQPGNRRSSELPSVAVALAVSRVGALRRLTACTQHPRASTRGVRHSKCCSRSCCLPHRNVNPGQCPVRGHFAAFRPLATALPAPLLP